MGIRNIASSAVLRIGRFITGTLDAEPPKKRHKGPRAVEAYRGFRRNAIYGRMPTGNTRPDMRKAIRGVSAALAGQRMMMTHAQRRDLAAEVELSRAYASK